MELFLNALWVALAVAAPLVWLSCYKGQLSRRDVVIALLAFGCIAILLFPVISATDDAHAIQAATEESNSHKKLGAHFPGYSGCPLAGIAIAWIITLVTSRRRVVLGHPTAFYSYLSTVNIFNRPPPPRRQGARSLFA